MVNEMEKVVVRTDVIPKNVWREILNYLDKNWSEFKVVRKYRDREFNSYYLEVNMDSDAIYSDLKKRFVMENEEARRQLVDFIYRHTDQFDNIDYTEGRKVHFNWYKEWVDYMKFRSLYPSSVLIGKWLGKDWKKWLGE